MKAAALFLTAAILLLFLTFYIAATAGGDFRGVGVILIGPIPVFIDASDPSLLLAPVLIMAFLLLTTFLIAVRMSGRVRLE
ncbi:MAG: hypothetical protein RMK31_02150 [Candidatus Caldarchaeum sp.]|nr:hypothetical protein [Candidatus Caldarchaeum sp.]